MGKYIKDMDDRLLEINIPIAIFLGNKIPDFWTTGISFFSHDNNHFAVMDLRSKLCLDRDVWAAHKASSGLWFYEDLMPCKRFWYDCKG